MVKITPPSPPGTSGTTQVTVVATVPVANRPSFATGQFIVATSGVPKALPNVPIPDGFSVVVKASKANTGTITIGNSAGNAINTGTFHFKLAANESVKLFLTNLNAVWVDGDTSGDKIEYLVEQ